MEFIPGETLESFQFRNENEKMHVMSLLVEAVQEMHTFGVVHRDLKPHNIIV